MKTTIIAYDAPPRRAASEYPAYAQLARQARMRAWRKTTRTSTRRTSPPSSASGSREPRTNAEIRERVRRYDGRLRGGEWTPMIFARTLLPLVQLPPAGSWSDRGARELRD